MELRLDYRVGSSFLLFFFSKKFGPQLKIKHTLTHNNLNNTGERDFFLAENYFESRYHPCSFASYELFTARLEMESVIM